MRGYAFQRGPVPSTNGLDIIPDLQRVCFTCLCFGQAAFSLSNLTSLAFELAAVAILIKLYPERTPHIPCPCCEEIQRCF